ncbi:hypothetical protein JYU34_016585 [Plutella xylostella]|uniref:Secreted protein n=1 Tax=Plutella xylostella TaxID=51655 RepID=A0ABQ7Q3A0_PLUXY|nr:hypothetical protein JYU34_016585 [Plutella xylostella]
MPQSMFRWWVWSRDRGVEASRGAAVARRLSAGRSARSALGSHRGCGWTHSQPAVVVCTTSAPHDAPPHYIPHESRDTHSSFYA